MISWIILGIIFIIGIVWRVIEERKGKIVDKPNDNKKIDVYKIVLVMLLLFGYYNKHINTIIPLIDTSDWETVPYEDR
jgi:hypothetical protein